MCSRSTVLVQYLYGYKQDKYRTSTEQIPDKYRTTMDVSPLLERRKSMGMVFEGFWKDEAMIIMDIIIDADNNKERRTKQ